VVPQEAGLADEVAFPVVVVAVVVDACTVMTWCVVVVQEERDEAASVAQAGIGGGISISQYFLRCLLACLFFREPLQLVSSAKRQIS
jgi:hypothetical protein